MMRQPNALMAFLTAILLLGLTGCTELDVREALEHQKPKVSVADQRFTRLDFERVNMAFGIKVDNPNPVSIELGGLDYDLKLAGQNFASGKQKKTLRMGASGASRFELPLSLSYQEIFITLKSLKGKDTIPYELTTGLMIDVPLLGRLRYPVSTRGELPIPRLPKISLKSLRLDKLNFSYATILLTLEVDNPNAFGLALNRLDYDFKVNGKRWIKGNRANAGQLEEKGKSDITLPLTLNFMELGSSLYGLLDSGKPLNYSLSGKLNATSDNQLIGNFNMPFNRNGKVALSQ